MAKAKSKLSVVLSKPDPRVKAVYQLEQRIAAQLLLAQNRFIALENQTKALEEAICPRVAARLTALERHTKLQQEENQAVFRRLNADDKDKKQVFEVLTAIRGTVLGRVEAVEQDISAINKSVAILSSAIKVKPGVMVEDTPELRRAFGVNETEGQAAPLPSKATDRAKVSYLIMMIKREMGLEFTEQGMKRIIELIEKV
jgi:hypothetical protein